MIGYYKHLFIDTWVQTEQLALENQTQQKRFVNVSTVIILIYIAVGLSVVKYFGNASSFLPNILNGHQGKFSTWFYCTFYGTETGEFHQKLFWIFTIVLIYLIIPMLITKYVFRKNLSDYGINFKNVFKDYPLYVLMLTMMLPIVYFASSTHSFQSRYPLFHPKSGPLFPIFLWWQIAYFIQFIAVEFFFRGFILHGLKNKFGYYAVFISMVPYCMVHFGKPFGETIAAIIAGIILGTLSLKSRSIVMGVFIHYSVAITMDIFALYRQGILS
jgi:uncharacterized protein